MRRLLGLAAAAGLLLLLAMPTLAQSGRLFFTDETGQLDRARIERAAQPLLNRGAEVAVYLVDEGGGADDFQRRLEADGLASGQRLDVGLVAIYVSLSPRYSELAGGDRWNAALTTDNTIETLRTTKLNPLLAAGDFTGAFADTLGTIDDSIANPPTPGGGTTFNINFIPLVIGGFVLLGLVAGGGALLAWRSSARTLARARERYQEQRRAAAAAITDLAQALDKARDKAQFDAISYAPADAQGIGAAQAQVEATFGQAQVRFDDIGEKFEARRSPQAADYSAAADAYAQVVQQVGELQGALAQVEAQRRELDALAQQAPGEIDRAKKA